MFKHRYKLIYCTVVPHSSIHFLNCLTLCWTSPGFYVSAGYRPFESTVRKGEIAHYEQFLFFPCCFLSIQRTFCHLYQIWNCCMQNLSVWKSLTFGEIFTRQSRLLTSLRNKPFEIIVGKGENAVNQHFLLLPQCFLPYQEQILTFWSHLCCPRQMLLIWMGMKFCCLVKSPIFTKQQNFRPVQIRSICRQ